MKQYLYSLITDQRQGLIANLIKGVLFILSLFYGLLVKAHEFLYDKGILPAYRASKPVISVGNITLGGAGKTPLIIYLARYLLASSKHTVILTRGYMAGQNTQSDEVEMLSQLLPKVKVMVGSNRRVSIERALGDGSIDVFLCDDAFGHRPLKRDLDIVLIDATNPFGNGCLLPRGILREPLSALKRAHVLLITKADQGGDIAVLLARLKKINPAALLVLSEHRPQSFTNLLTQKEMGPDELKAQSVLLVSGIGNPASFKSTVARLGIKVEEELVYPDHYSFTKGDVDLIRKQLLENKIKCCVTTHKDAVKIAPLLTESDMNFWYLNIALTITKNEDEFRKVLTHCFSA